MTYLLQGMPDPVLTQQLLQSVQQAGAAIMNFFAASDTALAVKTKSDQSPVTAADLAAHRVLTEHLYGLTPDLPVVSEEDEHSAHDRLCHERYWLIDPLDGTREFISGHGEFTVNLALIAGNAAVWGCVHAPALNQTYWGGRGMGAFRCDPDGQTVALHVATGAHANTGWRVMASKSHLDPETTEFIKKLGPTTLVQAGSSLKFCRVSEGVADIYPRLGPTCEWDTAAAQAILEAAGGVVQDLHGQPLRYGKHEVLNPFFIAARPDIRWARR